MNPNPEYKYIYGGSKVDPENLYFSPSSKILVEDRLYPGVMTISGSPVFAIPINAKWDFKKKEVNLFPRWGF